MSVGNPVVIAIRFNTYLEKFTLQFESRNLDAGIQGTQPLTFDPEYVQLEFASSNASLPGGRLGSSRDRRSPAQAPYEGWEVSAQGDPGYSDRTPPQTEGVS